MIFTANDRQARRVITNHHEPECVFTNDLYIAERTSYNIRIIPVTTHSTKIDKTACTELLEN